MNSATLKKNSSWVDAPFVTSIFIWLTFVAVLILGSIMKLNELRRSFLKLTDS
jgi:hypothetical protein